jgi:hypothetical protein
MHWPRNRLKKVPLPFSRTYFSRDRTALEDKLDNIVWASFRRMFGDAFSINTSQRKEWGRFLSERGIVWEVRLRNKPNWEGWEIVEGRDCVTVRPRGTEDHIRINHYLVPKELATRMLALGELL